MALTATNILTRTKEIEARQLVLRSDSNERYEAMKISTKVLVGLKDRTSIDRCQNMFKKCFLS